jgi:agmatinase
VARRVLDMGATVVQFGIRSVCREEIDVIRAETERVRVFFAEDVHAGGHLAELERLVSGRTVFLTIDVDGLDPSVMPATGTPEPNGLSWNQALDIVRVVARAGNVVAIDCVELAPIHGSHASEFITAKLVYKTLSLALAGRAKRGMA